VGKITTCSLDSTAKKKRISEDFFSHKVTDFSEVPVKILLLLVQTNFAIEYSEHYGFWS